MNLMVVISWTISSKLEVKVRTAIEHCNHPGFMLFAPCLFPQALFGYGLRCGVD
jgi:hypothetical protein